MTFQDAAAGFDYLSTVAGTYPLDLSRVITMGHSAGGHLAFWIAGRHHIEPPVASFQPGPQVPLLGALSLAGAVDLRLTIEMAGDLTFAHDRDEVHRLMGGGPEAWPQRYRAGNPGDLLPLGAPQILVQGSEDDQIPPELPHRWAEMARSRGSHAEVTLLHGADHFDVVDPGSAAWPAIREHVGRLLRI